MKRVSALGLLLLITCGVSNAVNPGFQTAITSNGLNYIVKVGLPILEAELKSLKIPDVSGDAHSPIGTIEYSLSNIVLQSFSIPSAALTTSSSGLTVAAGGISLQITANWHYKDKDFPWPSDSGTCDVSGSSISLKVTIVVGVDSKGHPTLKSTGCSLDIGSLSIKFHGGQSWLYNLFSSYIASALKGNIQSQVCQQAMNAIDTQGNKALESLPVITPIDSTSEIDYALIAAPVFTSSYVETQHKGEFYNRNHPQEAPFSPPKLPGVQATQRMMYLWLTDYMADTAGYVYQKAGLLQYELTPENTHIPPEIPFKLNTTSFKLFLPQLYKVFPNMAMVVNISALTPPTLVISPKSINFTVPGEVIVYVRFANKTLYEAFTLGVTMYASADVAIHSGSGQENITAKAYFLRANITLMRSNIGPFDVTVLQLAANTLCTAFVIPALNKYAAVGFPIPTVDGVSLVDSAIQLGDHYILISTDFSYKPTYWCSHRP